ncbi:MAG: hypothetical protein IKI02_03805 [Oscillospiraceae bacterium]|nr:hypothetical protein [Oscillospiraceae bacterium]
MAALEQPKALMIFLNNRELLEELSDAERGRLLLALLDYQERGTLPEFEGELRIVFKILRRDVDQSIARWEAECAKRSAAGKKSAAVRAAKKFAKNVSCNNDLFADDPSEEDTQELEQPETALNETEQFSAELSGVERLEAAFNGAERSSTALNSVEQASTVSTNTHTHSQSHSHTQSHSQSHTQALSCPSTQARTQTNPDSYEASSDSPALGRGRAEDFERFWQVYPRKVGKQAARKAFDRVGVPVERLLAALERQRADPQWRRENGRYIPHPVTWLNQGRWEDEGSAPTPQDCRLYGIECL